MNDYIIHIEPLGEFYVKADTNAEAKTKASEAAALKAGEEKIAKGPEFWIAGTIEVRKK